MSYVKAISLIGRQGRANPSDYRIVFPQRVTKFSPATDFSDYVSYFCRAATLPGTSHTVVNVKGQENMGISRPFITGRNFGSPVVLTFSERADLVMYTTLKGWMDSCIVNSDQRTLNRSLRVNYYDDIKCDVLIYKLEPKYNRGGLSNDPGDRGHLVTGIWKLINCVPLAIEQSTMAVEATDSLMDFTISIAYESFEFQPYKDFFDNPIFKLPGIADQQIASVTNKAVQDIFYGGA